MRNIDINLLFFINPSQLPKAPNTSSHSRPTISFFSRTGKCFLVWLICRAIFFYIFPIEMPITGGPNLHDAASVGPLFSIGSVCKHSLLLRVKICKLAILWDSKSFCSFILKSSNKMTHNEKQVSYCCILEYKILVWVLFKRFLNVKFSRAKNFEICAWNNLLQTRWN